MLEFAALYYFEKENGLISCDKKLKLIKKKKNKIKSSNIAMKILPFILRVNLIIEFYYGI